jgi:hypothetical protein
MYNIDGCQKILKHKKTEDDCFSKDIVAGHEGWVQCFVSVTNREAKNGTIPT